MRVELDIPDNVDLGLSEFDIKMMIGCHLYEKGVVSSGFAAEILGIDKAVFISNMGKYGKSLFERSDDEFEEDKKNALLFAR
jgi:predicted HTH domain antitoxin